MKRHLLVSALFVFAGACSTELQSPPGREEAPSAAISDAAHGVVGNPEFFFLPPLVPNPRGSPAWSPDGFNPALEPTVSICVLDLPAGTGEGDVQVGTPCRPGGYALTLPFVTRGNDGVRLHRPNDRDWDDDEEDRADRGGHYHAKWRVPKSGDVYYRIRVQAGTVVLGFADVHSVGSGRDLRAVNRDAFVARRDGETVQIKFRIENRALCADPAGTGPCVSAVVDLAAGGTVALTTDPAAAASGVGIPPQPSQSGSVIVTVETCPDLNPRAIDLPVFGGCLRIVTSPALTQPLNPPATVFVCDYPPDVSSLPHEQQERVTLHRLRTDNVVEAVPHALADCTPPVVAGLDRFRNAIRSLAQGRWRAVGQDLAGLIGPTPLLALDRGGGGLVAGFSDFQFALPCKMTVDAGDGQTGVPGAALPVDPTVRLTDLEEDPCAGATVHFAGTGTVGAPSVLTDAAGRAAVSWSLGGGPNQLVASGRGVAGGNADGPRSAFDPFMALEPHFNPFNDPVPNPLVPVPLQVGTRVFGAVTTAVPYRSPGWSARVLPSSAALPAGWELPGYDETAGGFGPGAAAFGSLPSECALNGAGLATTWPRETTLLLRRVVGVPAPATLRIDVAVDNDVQVFVDGNDVSGGLREHEGCPTRGSFTFTAPVSAGNHLIAVRGRDRGVSTYLDVEVAILP